MMRLIGDDHVAPAPWKNGGGTTRELLRIDDAASGDWWLRISVADIEASGPFSRFEGIERSFAVLSGHGVVLVWPGDADQETMTPRSLPLAFDGGRAPDCRLIDRPTRDLNVMTRRAVARAELRRAALAEPVTWDGVAFGVFALCALELDRAGERVALPAFTLAWQDDAAPQPWSLSLPAGVSAADGLPREGAPPAYWIGVRRTTPDPGAP